jgi:hypothetical protein
LFVIRRIPGGCVAHQRGCWKLRCPFMAIKSS